MFGYITINKPELKIREYERYHSFYCGLCRTLKDRYGRSGQITLTYDMTFLIVLLTSLYEPETVCETRRCVLHPARKHVERTNVITAYTADMNIALTFHKMLDDWRDDRSLRAITAMNLLQGSYQHVRNTYPKICHRLEACLRRLSAFEAENVQDIDRTAGCFGQLMGTLFAYREDIWTPYLQRFGFFLGKFIYILDAWLDLEEDQRKNHYNPLYSIASSTGSKAAFDQTILSMLELMMKDACLEFEKLPLEQDLDLLRNILYAGVWKKYESRLQSKQCSHNKKG